MRPHDIWLDPPPAFLVYGLLIMAVADFERPCPLQPNQQPYEKAGESLLEYVHLPDRSAIADAADLIDRFGIHALSEAAARADRSRELGNVIHFCRWRQIERIIPILASERAEGTVH